MGESTRFTKEEAGGNEAGKEGWRQLRPRRQRPGDDEAPPREDPEEKRPWRPKREVGRTLAELT